MGRRLERHIDADLVDRILANGPMKRTAKPVRVDHECRPANIYRGQYNRFIDGRTHAASKWQTEPVNRIRHHPPVTLNRSRHLPFASSYADARKFSRASA